MVTVDAALPRPVQQEAVQKGLAFKTEGLHCCWFRVVPFGDIQQVSQGRLDHSRGSRLGLTR